MQQVAVISKNGEALMPTKRLGVVRRLLKTGQATIIVYKPICTIQLHFETTSYTQALTLGVDSGYQHIGYSVVTAKEEVVGGEVINRHV